jgi:ketosteroid isomerase-like protein
MNQPLLSKSRSVISVFLVVLAVAGFIFGQAKNDAAAQIKAELDKTASGWNEGNLTTYLAAYVPTATEMTGEGPKGGVEEIEKTMKVGFWKTGRPVQNLHYENVVVRMLGKKYALVTGQYVLSGANRPDRKGWFTTVWTKASKNWRMIHDHS